jgi:hypothetical protein
MVSCASQYPYVGYLWYERNIKLQSSSWFHCNMKHINIVKRCWKWYNRFLESKSTADHSTSLFGNAQL